MVVRCTPIGLRKDEIMSDSDMRRDLDEALASVRSLQNRIIELELKGSVPAVPTPTTSLLSDSFLKRAFTIWGHNFVAGLIIAAPVWFIIIIVLAIAGSLN